MAAAPGAMVGLASECLQISQRVIAQDDDLSSASTVAAVGPAAGHVRFTTKARAAVTAGAGLDMDSSAVMKHEANRDSHRAGERRAIGYP